MRSLLLQLAAFNPRELEQHAQAGTCPQEVVLFLSRLKAVYRQLTFPQTIPLGADDVLFLIHNELFKLAHLSPRLLENLHGKLELLAEVAAPNYGTAPVMGALGALDTILKNEFNSLPIEAIKRNLVVMHAENIIKALNKKPCSNAEVIAACHTFGKFVEVNFSATFSEFEHYLQNEFAEQKTMTLPALATFQALQHSIMHVQKSLSSQQDIRTLSAITRGHQLFALLMGNDRVKTAAKTLQDRALHEETVNGLRMHLTLTKEAAALNQLYEACQSPDVVDPYINDAVDPFENALYQFKAFLANCLQQQLYDDREFQEQFFAFLETLKNRGPARQQFGIRLATLYCDMREKALNTAVQTYTIQHQQTPAEVNRFVRTSQASKEIVFAPQQAYSKRIEEARHYVTATRLVAERLHQQTLVYAPRPNVEVERERNELATLKTSKALFAATTAALFVLGVVPCVVFLIYKAVKGVEKPLTRNTQNALKTLNQPAPRATF